MPGGRRLHQRDRDERDVALAPHLGRPEVAGDDDRQHEQLRLRQHPVQQRPEPAADDGRRAGLAELESVLNAARSLRRGRGRRPPRRPNRAAPGRTRAPLRPAGRSARGHAAAATSAAANAASESATTQMARVDPLARERRRHRRRARGHRLQQLVLDPRAALHRARVDRGAPQLRPQVGDVGDDAARAPAPPGRASGRRSSASPRAARAGPAA